VEHGQLVRLLAAPVLRRAIDLAPCSHFATVLRDSPVMRAISRSDFFFRLCKRRILPIMSMVILLFLCCTKMQQGRLFTWLNIGSARWLRFESAPTRGPSAMPVEVRSSEHEGTSPVR
jgi:hypothetical protein